MVTKEAEALAEEKEEDSFMSHEVGQTNKMNPNQRERVSFSFFFVGYQKGIIMEKG